MAKTASLTSGLVAKKGQAAPVSAHSPEVTSPPAPVEAGALAKRIAMTVKLEPSQYEALKIFAAKRRMKSQEVFVEALTLYLREAGHQG